MNITHFISEWIAAGNSFDTDRYLEFYLPDAILDDPSVGRVFSGRKQIQSYFDSYFIGYQTQTRQVNLTVAGNTAHLEVVFKGSFAEQEIGGTFDFVFENGKIATVEANLIHD
ncbi:YybH family protein [Pedobacter frigidisoli]|uniref:YybH family protein n=1 Tax=Pedobacter frigidisoli TaxID=2530455 RepID=UPI002930C082|nr:nuclear transport factor 2 family protein [Pedobacter frigidisoli]